jgi:hypothetical protein
MEEGGQRSEYPHGEVMLAGHDILGKEQDT